MGSAMFDHINKMPRSSQTEALAKGNDSKAHAFQILYHVYSTPVVKGILPDY